MDLGFSENKNQGFLFHIIDTQMIEFLINCSRDLKILWCWMLPEWQFAKNERKEKATDRCDVPAVGEKEHRRHTPARDGNKFQLPKACLLRDLVHEFVAI